MLQVPTVALLTMERCTPYDVHICTYLAFIPFTGPSLLYIVAEFPELAKTTVPVTLACFGVYFDAVV